MEQMIEYKSIDQVYTFLQQESIREDFIASIYSILRGSSIFSLNVLNMFALFGGHARAELKGHVDLPVMDHVSSLVIQARNGFSWDIHFYVELAVKFIDRNLILEPLDYSLAKLCTTLHCSSESIKQIRSIRIHFKQVALQLIAKSLQLCLHSSGAEIPANFSKSVVLSPASLPLLSAPQGAAPSGESAQSGSARVLSSEDVVESLSTLSDQDRSFCLGLLGLFIARGDVDIKSKAHELLVSYLAYFAGLFVSYAAPSTSSVSRSFTYQASRSSLLGPEIPTYPLGLAVVPDSLNPFLLFHVLVLFLQRDQSVVSSIAILVIDLLISQIRQLQPDSMLLEGFVLESFLRVASQSEMQGHWRLKANLLPVYLHITTILPDFAVSRASGLLIRFASRVLAVVPTELAVPTQSKAFQLIFTLLRRVFHVPIEDPFLCWLFVMSRATSASASSSASASESTSASDSDSMANSSNPVESDPTLTASNPLSSSDPANLTDPLNPSKPSKPSAAPLTPILSPTLPNPSNSPEIASMVAQEAALLAEKRQDFVSVVLDGLLGLRNTLARTMQDLIAMLAKTENSSELMQIMREQIRQRKEFERVSHLTILMQYNTYRAMSQCLELGFFQVTDKVAATVVMEAAKNIPHISNYEALIRNCSPYDCGT